MGSAASSKVGNANWQDEPKGNVHDALLSVFETVRAENAWRIDADEYHAGLYCASDRPGVKGESRRDFTYGPATLPYNLCRSAVDTLTSKIAQHRPLPQVLTQRGSWKNQKRARKMTQFLEGEFYRQKIFESHSAKIVRDAEVFGRGMVKVWTDGKRIRTERVHVWEVFTDTWDARYGDPRNRFHCRSMDRGVAVATFGMTPSGMKKAKVVDAIDKAGRFSITAGEMDMGTTSTVDRVDVLEAWHLPSSEDAGDGRHVVVIQGATLVDEPWEHDYFPFATLNYNDPLTGDHGLGLVEQLEGYQYEINMSSEKSSEQYRMSGKMVVIQDGSGIVNTDIRNGMSILNCRAGGPPPQVFDMDLVNEHMTQRPRELTQDGLGDAGLSTMSVRSEKPQGIDSGIGLQTLDDIETERFMVFGRAYETWCLDLARRFIDCAKQIAKDFGDLAVSVPMKGGLLDLKWNDVYVDGVEIRIFSSSLLPTQPAARLDRLSKMFDAQQIDRATFFRHLDAPDMQAEMDLEVADRLVIDEMLEAMLDAEEDQGEAAYIPPSAYQDLGWAGKRAQQKLNRGILDSAPGYNLDMLRRFLKEVDVENQKLEAKAAAKVALAQGAAANMNGAAPMPLPAAPGMAA